MSEVHSPRQPKVSETHRAKMKRKKAQRAIAKPGFQPIDGKRGFAFRLAAIKSGRAITFNHSNRGPSKITHTSIAPANRHTGRPHEHAREIARRARKSKGAKS